MIKKIIKNKPAYTTLISVLIIGTISLSIALTLLLSGINSSQITINFSQSAQARALAITCTEEALLKIRTNPNFFGQETITNNQGSCYYIINNQGQENREIIVLAQINSIFKKITISINQINPKINIINWQETNY